jgi:hypothetical protein
MPTLEEQKRELDAKLDAIFERRRVKPPGKPKVVTSDGAVVRDVKVRVSADDENARRRGSEVVEVQRPEPDWLRPDCVRINLAEAEHQYWTRQRAEATDRQQRRDADPYGMGHWGNSNRDEDR